MSSQLNEIADIPREFLREGTQFMNRCAKPDKREFIKISQAVGIGFVVMGAIGTSTPGHVSCTIQILTAMIGYVVKLSESNTILQRSRSRFMKTAISLRSPNRQLTTCGPI
ncbi:MAG: hypothetical protein Q9168_000396 [Polycauliona sp. 1 TL-2023]